MHEFLQIFAVMRDDGGHVVIDESALRRIDVVGSRGPWGEGARSKERER